MKRSKLETYVTILSVLSSSGPLKITHLMYKTNVNCTILKENMNYLMQQGTVEESISGKNKTVYSITQRGISVLKYFDELKNILPMIEEQNQALI